MTLLSPTQCSGRRFCYEQMLLAIKRLLLRVVAADETLANAFARLHCAKSDDAAAEASSREPRAGRTRVYQSRHKRVAGRRADRKVVSQTRV